MAKHETTIDVPILARSAAFQPDTVDSSARTVDMIWTTGAPVLRGYFNKYWEKLSLDPSAVRMGRLNNGAPLLNAHCDYDAMDVIGVVESAALGTPAIASVRFAKPDASPEAEQIFKLVQDGILQSSSVGYAVYRMEQQEDAPDGIPVFLAVDWEPYELSVVPMGADDGAGFRSADKRAPNKCVFVTRQQGKGTTMATEDKTPITTTTPGTSSAAVEATRAAANARIEDAKERAAALEHAAEQATSAERERVSEIRKIARRSRLGDIWADALIDAKTTVEEARTLAFDRMAADGEQTETRGPVGITAGEDARDKFVRGASAWLFASTGTQKLIESARAKKPEMFRDVAFDPGEFRGMSLVDLARASLERNAVSTRGVDKMRLVEMAFTHRAGQFQTSGDFPILLENVLGKVLLGAYATQSNTWERFCKTEDVPDFRPSGRYRTAALPGLDVLGEHQEYKTGIVPDGAKYALTTQRMGKIFAISQETIVNDDMGALTDEASKLGQAAMRSIENAVFALLTANSGLGPTLADTNTFFHATRANISTGAALTVTGIDADRVTFRAQKDPNGQDFLDLQPAVLLVPDSLNGQAKEVNDAQYEFGLQAAATSPTMRPNRVRGLFRDVVSSPRLTGTRRYLFADTMDAIVVAFLAGYGHGPVLNSQSGWRVDGVEWKVTLYARAQVGDPKAAVTNAGV